MEISGYKQIKLPEVGEDSAWGVRLQVGEWGICAGQSFRALFPNGERDITLEVGGEKDGIGGWYISTPGFKDVCPIGLWVRV